jgi:hypothetical protein
MKNSGHVDAHCPRQLMFAALVIPVGLAAGPRSLRYKLRGEKEGVRRDAYWSPSTR